MKDQVETQLYQTEGFADLERQFTEIIQHVRADTAVRQNFVKALRLAMEPVRAAVQENAPYDNENPRGPSRPFHLRDTVKLIARLPIEKDMKTGYGNENVIAVAVVSVKKSAVSLAMEYGTSRIGARMFMRKALKNQAENAIKIFKDQLSIMLPAYMAKINRRRGK